VSLVSTFRPVSLSPYPSLLAAHAPAHTFHSEKLLFHPSPPFFQSDTPPLLRSWVFPSAEQRPNLRAVSPARLCFSNSFPAFFAPEPQGCSNPILWREIPLGPPPPPPLFGEEFTPPLKQDALVAPSKPPFYSNESTPSPFLFRGPAPPVLSATTQLVRFRSPPFPFPRMRPRLYLFLTHPLDSFPAPTPALLTHTFLFSSAGPLTTWPTRSP